jgi:CTP synthase (UTP-ammonia lyase)
MAKTSTAARVALVGDRSANIRAHARIPQLLDALRDHEGIALDAYWIPTPDAESRDLAGFDAIWLVPGSPYASEEGAVAAVRTAREQGIPYLGTCGGFQHAMLEYARDVCGLGGVQHAENLVVRGGAGEPADLLIVPLECSLVGHEEAVMVVPGTLAASIIGPGRRSERYHCAYGLNDAYLAALAGAGLRFSGFDDGGQVRIVEVPGHPFFLATLFQPELSDGPRPHPLITAFARAAAEHSQAPQRRPEAALS